MPQRGRDLGDQLRPLETAERADGHAHRLLVAAVRTGSDEGEVARRRRTPIFGLQDREPRRERLRVRDAEN